MSTVSIALSKRGKHGGKYTAIVDEIDADLDDFNWQVSIMPPNLYAIRMRRQDKAVVQDKLHRVILSRMLNRELLPREICDHINGNGLDNRRENLRLATALENSQNKHSSRNKTGYKGVKRSSNNKYTATIQVKGIPICLGTFDTPELAHESYRKAAKEHFGEFANSGRNKIQS